MNRRTKRNIAKWILIGIAVILIIALVIWAYLRTGKNQTEIKNYNISTDMWTETNGEYYVSIQNAGIQKYSDIEIVYSKSGGELMKNIHYYYVQKDGTLDIFCIDDVPKQDVLIKKISIQNDL